MAQLFVVAILLVLAGTSGARPFSGTNLLAQQTPSLPPQSLEVAFPNLSFTRMTHLTHAGDGTDRLWVLLQAGQIMVFPNSPEVSTPAVFLDITGKVSREGNEEGMLGLAFDPSYTQNGYFYLYYSAANPRRSVISRFSVSANDPNLANPSSELVLLEVPQPYGNHNGGTLAFGPDGYLYIALGDGGSRGDPLGNGQNTSTLLGSILRIDVLGATAEQPYRIPADNPLAGVARAKGEIWAYGLRNPWKFSFDPATGELWAADVGQNNFEEVDLVKPGKNYGWNIMEGAHCYPPSVQTCSRSGLEMPVFEYTQAEGCSITGGHVYRGDRQPALVGAYVYADYCSGRIWGLRYDGSAVTNQALLVDSSLQIPAIAIDQHNELLILAFDGKIYQFVARRTPAPTPTASPLPPPTGDVRPLSDTVRIIALAGALLALAGGLLFAARIRQRTR